jgi:hypothetical protein
MTTDIVAIVESHIESSTEIQCILNAMATELNCETKKLNGMTKKQLTDTLVVYADIAAIIPKKIVLKLAVRELTASIGFKYNGLVQRQLRADGIDVDSYNKAIYTSKLNENLEAEGLDLHNPKVQSTITKEVASRFSDTGCNG